MHPSGAGRFPDRAWWEGVGAAECHWCDTRHYMSNRPPAAPPEQQRNVSPKTLLVQESEHDFCETPAGNFSHKHV